MIILDIITGEEYEIPEDTIRDMDRSQEEYQQEIDNNKREEQIKSYRNDYLN